MNKNDIIYLPNESLRTRSVKVGVVSDEIKQLIEDMKSATTDQASPIGAGVVPSIKAAVASVKRPVPSFRKN